MKNSGHRHAQKTVSLKSITFNNRIQKVNDVLGNPIIIGVVVVWRVDNPTRAVFNVENYSGIPVYPDRLHDPEHCPDVSLRSY